MMEDIASSFEGRADCCIVRVPAGTANRRQLFDCLKAGLKFPKGFGNNWDAFDECISDLSWLEATTVLIAHEEFPPLPDEDLGSYLDILRTAIEEWREHGGKRLIVTFG